MFLPRTMITGAALAAALLSLPAAAAPVAVAADAPDSLAASPFIIADGDTLWLAPTLEVVGSRVPAALPVAVRRLEILGQQDLESAPARSAAELLQAVPGVVTGQRQHYGVQSDLSIRGSTFEQVQVLLDGFDVSDAQTGHHALDLPLARQDIERLEVLQGQGSALYGSGAFGGVVNVVSRDAGARAGGEIAAAAGGLGIWQARGSLTDVSEDGDTGLRLSFDRFHSDGQDLEQPDGGSLRNGSDLWAITSRLDQQQESGEASVFVGWARRRFGALDFYAPYPSFEHTETLFASARLNRSLNERWTLEPRVFFRRHSDRFVLIRSNPGAYLNDHVTRRVGTELRGIGVLDDRHTLAFGLEGVYEDLDSQGVRGGVRGPAMGDHLRRRLSFSAELDRHTGCLRWQTGGRLDARPGRSPRFSGTVAAARDLADEWTLRGSLGSVYRLPTWTELYYTSPVNLGDSRLQPETGWVWDGGLDWRRDVWTAQLTYFERRETDGIDWTLAPGGETFEVTNIAEATVRGVELSGRWRHSRGHHAGAGWAWLEKDLELPADYLARYSLQTPRHVLTGSGTLILPARLAATLAGRYIERTDGAGSTGGYRVAFVLDGRLDWQGPRGFFASLTGTNLLDRRYEEVPGVAMPGTVATLEVGRRF